VYFADDQIYSQAPVVQSLNKMYRLDKFYQGSYILTLVRAIGINDVFVVKRPLKVGFQHCNYVGIIIIICVKMVVLLIHWINVAML
jgi:hypothetical protein